MGTRSLIGKVNSDETVTFVYCHWDGYPSYNGRILNEHYDEEKLDQLLALGNISSLKENIGEKHDFNERIEGVTTFYGRDRGEKDQEAVTVDNLDAFLVEFNNSWTEYAYILKDGNWLIFDKQTNFKMGLTNEDFVELRTVLGLRKCN
jgi:hypothetical protein